MNELNTTVQSETLKPCPFCGEEAKLSRLPKCVFVTCTNCWAEEGRKWNKDQEAEAIAAWNERSHIAAQDAEIARKDAAIERIARWVGEFPDTGRRWKGGEPMSYGACYGSHGERDYMRNIARSALNPETGHD